MKKKVISMSLLSAICLGIAGCGEKTYKITASTENSEYGYVTGAGNYTLGSTVGLKIYSNKGCTLSKIEFIDSENKATEISDFEAVEDKYHYYDFVVSSETIGHYKPIYSCDTRAAGDSVVKGGYNVTYLVDLNGDNTISETETDGEKTVVNVNSGAKAENKKYLTLGTENVKVEWYTEATFTNKYDFTKAVNSDITLYGKLISQTTLELVVEALANLHEHSTKISVNGNNKQINIENYKKTDDSKVAFDYFTELDADKDGLELLAMYRNPSGTAASTGKKYLYFVDYVSNNGVQSRLEVSASSTPFNTNDVKTAFLSEFLVLSDYESLTESQLSVSGDNITVTKGEDTYILTISQGLLTAFNKNGVSYTVNYENGVSQTADISAPTLYTVKLTSDDEELKAKLESYNTLDKVIRVVPSRGETVSSALLKNSEINEELKNYGYSIVDKLASDAIYDITEKTEKHLYLGVDVKMSMTDIIGAYGDLSVGDYKITTTATTEMGTQTQTWEANGLDVTSATSKPSDMLTVVWNSISKIALFDEKDYFKVEYDDTTKEMLVYLEETSAFAELRIKLSETGQMDVVKYTVRGSDGSITTYTNTFTYIAGIRYVSDLGRGGYTLNTNSVVSWDLYFDGEYDYSETKPTDFDQTAWDFFKTLNDLKNDYASYEWDDTAKTFTKGEGETQVVYTFTVDANGKVSKVTYKASAEATPVEYNLNQYLFNALIGVEMMKEYENIAYLDDGVNYNLIQFADSKPNNISQEAHDLLSKLANLEGYTYTYSYENKTHTFTKDADTIVIELSTEPSLLESIMSIVGIKAEIRDITKITYNSKVFTVVNDYLIPNVLLANIEEYYNLLGSEGLLDGYEYLNVSVGETTVVYENVGTKTLDEQLTDTTNVVVRMIKQLKDIRNNPKNYTIENNTVKNISTGKVVISYDPEDLLSSCSYYENGVLIGEIFVLAA